MNKLVSIIIPVYNEEKVIANCLASLAKQTYKPLEIILVDDGSTDKTLDIIKTIHYSLFSLRKYALIFTIHLFRQKHLGPGPARNLGASKAKGKILVFVDADMTFDKDFIKDLIKPILDGQTIGTFSKNEMNANASNIWSTCWNINRGWPIDRLIPPFYPDTAPVFRAIKKAEFDKAGGFDATGEYTDDWSLSRKLAKKSTRAKGAIYYHSNPSTLAEVWRQARWIGKNEFISGTLIRRVRSSILYSMPVSLAVGIFKSVAFRKISGLSSQLSFVIFKLIYDTAIWISTIKSFFGERKSK